MADLSPAQLRTVASGIARALDGLEIDYAIMGGAAVNLLLNDTSRQTEDMDLVIQVDERGITADRLTMELVKTYPTEFGTISQYGHHIPAYKLTQDSSEGEQTLVQLEIFDYESWPHRPQYNLEAASRETIKLNGQNVKVFSAAWLLREKLLSQYQRSGSTKGISDIQDISIISLFAMPGQAELDFDANSELIDALKNFLQKRPDLEERLKQKIKCSAIFGN
ncbi:hypothetical protein AJ80_00352 [Polytolypa hystricis UAMH7299]|uniref:Uncharacterized protein n=1 Tax=Polytolypa hystricis (strain UAMH7299) TaxID=1447883 RepID=A0A2B7YVI0_POLH7|nr:hypothetical protein AJ80_00352 [Polytolypa hystricis UAMH7299]